MAKTVRIAQIESDSKVRFESRSCSSSPFVAAYPETFDLDQALPSMSATNSGTRTQVFKASDFR
jgi:hypothetical protein